jgi:hypothetical protein
MLPARSIAGVKVLPRTQHVGLRGGNGATPNGHVLPKRLDAFRIPHEEVLTARHSARGARAQRNRTVANTSTNVLFSEGEQRSLALADFAAELDSRPGARHAVLLDEPRELAVSWQLGYVGTGANSCR